MTTRSYVFYNPPISSPNLAVPFDFLDKSHVQVWVGNVRYVEGTDYTWTSLAGIVIASAKFDGTKSYLIKRVTPPDKLLVEQQASVYSHNDANYANWQVLYVAQESQDLSHIVKGFADDALASAWNATHTATDAAATATAAATTIIGKVNDAKASADASAASASSANSSAAQALANKNATDTKAAAAQASADAAQQSANQASAIAGGNFLPKTGGTLTGPLVLAGDATQDLHPVTKRQQEVALTPLATTSNMARLRLNLLCKIPGYLP